jgi:hypothetical protein
MSSVRLPENPYPRAPNGLGDFGYGNRCSLSSFTDTDTPPLLAPFVINKNPPSPAILPNPNPLLYLPPILVRLSVGYALMRRAVKPIASAA